MASIPAPNRGNFIQRTAQVINNHPALKVALLVSAIALMVLGSVLTMGAALGVGAFMGVVAGLSVKALMGTGVALAGLSAVAIGRVIYNLAIRSKFKDALNESKGPTVIAGPTSFEGVKELVKETKGLANIKFGCNILDKRGETRSNFIIEIQKHARYASTELKGGDPISTFIKYAGTGLPLMSCEETGKLLDRGMAIERVGEVSVEVTQLKPHIVEYTEKGTVEGYSTDDYSQPGGELPVKMRSGYEMHVVIERGENGEPTKTTMTRTLTKVQSGDKVRSAKELCPLVPKDHQISLLTEVAAPLPRSPSSNSEGATAAPSVPSGIEELGSPEVLGTPGPSLVYELDLSDL